MSSRRIPVAVVTGATQGIGRAIAEQLAGDGYYVGVNGRSETPQMKEVVETVRGFAVPADIYDRTAVEEAIAEIDQRHDGIDVLVCNAAYMSMAPLTDHDEDDWWKVVDTNLGGTFHTIAAALPGMRRIGHGRIVIVTSEWGVTGWPNATAYAASKAGLIALTKTLGRELARENIVVNAVAPGVIDTPQLEVDAADAGISLPEMRQRYAEGIPLGRIGHPEEIASAVALLARPQLGSVIGQTFQINGGTTRCRV